MKAKVYTDGSCSVKGEVISLGWAYTIKVGEDVISAHGNDIEEGFKPQRNVAAECTAAIRAIEKLEELGVESAVIYHDYEGLGKWATGLWRTKNIYTTEYVTRVKQSQVKLEFVWVKGHSGVTGNDEVDRLAVEARKGNLMDEIRIHTGNFRMKFPDNVYRVSISNSTPDGVELKRIPALVPPWEIVKGYKEGKLSEKKYTEKYIAYITESTKKWPGDTLGERLERMFKKACENAGSRHIALLCWEKEGEFCHRRIVYTFLPISIRGEMR